MCGQCRVIHNRETRRSGGLGSVQMHNREEAEAALEGMGRLDLMEGSIRCTKSPPSRELHSFNERTKA